jgi:hypothetical protein
MKMHLAALAGALFATIAGGGALAQITTEPPTTEAAPIPRFTVEIIVFANRDFDPGEERFAQEIPPIAIAPTEFLQDVPVVEEPEPVPPPSTPPATEPEAGSPATPEAAPAEDPLAVRIMAPEELMLGNEFRRLTNLSAYHPLVHAGWVLPGLPEEQSVAFDLGSLGVTNPRGTVRVYLSRFLHVNLDLTYQDGTAATLPTSDGELNEVSLAPRYRLVTERQLRSGELHYFDHPAFGVLLKITPVPVETGDGSASRRPAA